MIKAIVYNSNTGFTKKYAEMLSEKIGIPCYEAEKAHYVLVSGDEIIYMAWCYANSLKGLKKFSHLYKVKAVCAVGLAEMQQGTEQIKSIAGKLKGEIPVFYLRGGIDIDKLKGMNKFFINQVSRILRGNGDEKEKNIKKAINEGADFVKSENLDGIVSWYNEISA